MSQQVPPPLKKQGLFAFSPLDLREIAVLAIFVGAAIAILFTMPGSLTLRVFFSTLLSGTGLALAFATVQGEKLEVWLYRTIMFQTSSRLRVWRRHEEIQYRPVQFTDETPQPAAKPPLSLPRLPSLNLRFHRPVSEEVKGDISFLIAMADVVVFAIFASLSVYLATGGAQQLVAYVKYIGQ